MLWTSDETAILEAVRRRAARTGQLIRWEEVVSDTGKPGNEVQAALHLFREARELLYGFDVTGMNDQGGHELIDFWPRGFCEHKDCGHAAVAHRPRTTDDRLHVKAPSARKQVDYCAEHAEAHADP